MKKIMLYVMGKKGYECLKFAVNNYFECIHHVIYEHDMGLDEDYGSRIEEVCITNKIPFSNRRKSSYIECDFSIAIGWRWMLPPRDTLIIIHDSLLPKNRGFSPLVNSLISGDTEIGATVLFGANDYDAGDVIAQKSKIIKYPKKISEAIDDMVDIYLQLLSQLFVVILSNKKISAIKQDKELATYSLWRDEEDYWIDWKDNAEEISRFINALGSPYSGARCLVNGVEAVIHDAVVVTDRIIIQRQSSIGKVIYMEDGFPIVVCGAGLLKIVNITLNTGESLLPLSVFRTRFTGKKL